MLLILSQTFFYFDSGTTDQEPEVRASSDSFFFMGWDGILRLLIIYSKAFGGYLFGRFRRKYDKVSCLHRLTHTHFLS